MRPDIHIVYDGAHLEIAHRQHISPKFPKITLRNLNRIVLQWARKSLGEGGFSKIYCTFISAKLPESHPNPDAEAERKELLTNFGLFEDDLDLSLNYEMVIDYDTMIYDPVKGWRQSEGRDAAIIRAIEAAKPADWLVVGTVDNDMKDKRFKTHGDSIRKAIERRDQRERTAQLWCESPPNCSKKQSPGPLLKDLVAEVLRVSFANDTVELFDDRGTVYREPW